MRFTHIFFGMLTLAFGMLLHSFLFKFYNLTGGDQGLRVLRPMLLGRDWDMTATQFLSGPFYYYCLIVYALLGLLTWRIVGSPLGLQLRAIRDNENKARYLGVRVYRLRLFAFVISGCLCFGSSTGKSLYTIFTSEPVNFNTSSANSFKLISFGLPIFTG